MRNYYSSGICQYPGYVLGILKLKTSRRILTGEGANLSSLNMGENLKYMSPV